jgi:LEA14-like dessication related protein
MRNIVCILLLAIAGVTSCKQPQALVYKDVQHIKYQGFGAGQPGLSMDVLLYNPNNFSLKLRDADIDVYVNNKFMGKMFVIKGKYSIPAMGSFLVPLKVDVDLNNVLPNAIGLLLNHTAEFKVMGKIKAGKHGIYITMPVHYEGKQEIHL